MIVYVVLSLLLSLLMRTLLPSLRADSHTKLLDPRWAGAAVGAVRGVECDAVKNHDHHETENQAGDQNRVHVATNAPA